MKEIVVIEDNDTMRLGIVESLRREGFWIKDFADGETALKYLQEHPVISYSNQQNGPGCLLKESADN